MSKSTILALAGTLTFAALMPLVTYAESESVPVVAGGATGEVTGTVMIVNTEKRMLTIKKPDGTFEVIHVPDEVQRLDEIKINDKLTISYLAAVAVDLEKRTDAGVPAVMSTKEIDRGSGKKPSGSMVETVTILGVVEALNKAKSTVTIKGPERVVTLTVEDSTLLADVKVGDGVRATFVNAVAAKVTR